MGRLEGLAGKFTFQSRVEGPGISSRKCRLEGLKNEKVKLTNE
jgi:hypothetical protein